MNRHIVYLDITKIPGLHGLPRFLHGRGKGFNSVHNSLAGATTPLNSQASWPTIYTLPEINHPLTNY